jgi:hypothetical protein
MDIHVLYFRFVELVEGMDMMVTCRCSRYGPLEALLEVCLECLLSCQSGKR